MESNRRRNKPHSSAFEAFVEEQQAVHQRSGPDDGSHVAAFSKENEGPVSQRVWKPYFPGYDSKFLSWQMGWVGGNSYLFFHGLTGPCVVLTMISVNKIIKKLAKGVKGYLQLFNNLINTYHCQDDTGASQAMEEEVTISSDSAHLPR